MRALALTTALLALTGNVLAQGATAYPVRPVRVVVPFAPGGGSDIVSRLVAQRLTESLGQQFIVDNRPGASANIGHAIVAKAAPDGHSILLGTAIRAIRLVRDNPSMRSRLRADPLPHLTQRAARALFVRADELDV